MPTNAQDFRARFSHECDENVEILGLWDTVSAYGMPIDELAECVNTCIYRIKFQSQEISWKIRRAYHALALDDERRTFTPLLIHSVEDGPDSATTDVEQVWFAGMHSDVGGGYANCNLALIPLEWMIRRAKKAGLIFHPPAVDEIKSQASILGEMHDSRSGLGRIYRPKVRDLDQLCKLAKNTIVPQPHVPVVHSSALARIVQGIQGYAPVAVPTIYYDSQSRAKVTHTPCDIKSLDCSRRFLHLGQLVGLGGLLNTEGGRWVLSTVLGGLSAGVPQHFTFPYDELVWLGALGLLLWLAAFFNRRIQTVGAAAWGATIRRHTPAPALTPASASASVSQAQLPEDGPGRTPGP